MTEKKQWIHFADIMKSKEDKLYIKVREDIKLEKDQMVVMKKKSEQIKQQFKNGFISEERRDELLEKLSFIKYELLLPPGDDS